MRRHIEAGSRWRHGRPDEDLRQNRRRNKGHEQAREDSTDDQRNRYHVAPTRTTTRTAVLMVL